MSGFLVFKKLSIKEAVETMENIEKWFRENPTRRRCKTDLFVIRRGHLVEDILKRTVEEAK